MAKKINNKKKKYKFSYNNYDPDLPEAPKLEIYQETFNGLKNITDEYYKE